MVRAWSPWAGGGQAVGLSTGCPRVERGPLGRSTYPRALSLKLEGYARAGATRPDAFGGLRRSRAALAPELEGQRNQARGDLLKGKGVGGVRRCFHLGNTAEKWGYFLHFC